MNRLLIIALTIGSCSSGTPTGFETSEQVLVDSWLRDYARNNLTQVSGGIYFMPDPLSIDMLEISRPLMNSIDNKEIAVVRAKWRQRGSAYPGFSFKESVFIVEDNKIVFVNPWARFEKEGLESCIKLYQSYPSCQNMPILGR